MNDLISKSALWDAILTEGEKGLIASRSLEEIIDEQPTIEFISTDCVNVNKVIEEACAIWEDNDGDTAMQTLIEWLKEYAPRVIAVPLKHVAKMDEVEE